MPMIWRAFHPGNTVHHFILNMSRGVLRLSAAFVAAMLVSMAAASLIYQLALLAGFPFRWFAWLWFGLTMVCAVSAVVLNKRGWFEQFGHEVRRISETPGWAILLSLVLLSGAVLGVLNSTWTDDDWGHLHRLAPALNDPSQPITIREEFLPPPFNQTHAYFIPYALTHMYGAVAWLTGIDILQLHFNVGGAFGITGFLLGCYLLLRVLGATPQLAVLVVCILFAYCGIDNGWHAFGNRVLGKPWMMKHLALITFTPLLLAALASWTLSGKTKSYVYLLLVVAAALALGLNTVYGLPLVLGGFGLALLVTSGTRDQLLVRFRRLCIAATASIPWLLVSLHYAVSVEPDFRIWVDTHAWSWQLERAFNTPDSLMPLWHAIGLIIYLPPLEFIFLITALALMLGPYRTAAKPVTTIMAGYSIVLLVLVLNPWVYSVLIAEQPSLSLTFFRLFYLLLAPLSVAIALALLLQSLSPCARLRIAAVCVASVAVLAVVFPRASVLGKDQLTFRANLPSGFLEQVSEIASMSPPSPVFSYHRFAKVAPLIAPSMTHLHQSSGGLLNSASRTDMFDVARIIDRATPVFYQRGSAEQKSAFATVLDKRWPCSVVTWKGSRGDSFVMSQLEVNGYKKIHETQDFSLFVTDKKCGIYN